MKGSIRAIGGLLIAFGAVGGIETGSALIPCVIAAVIGLALMASGVDAINGRRA